MSNVLILYSSTDGQTLKIGRFIENVLIEMGDTVTVSSIAKINSLDLMSFDKFVLGSSVRYGTHCKKMKYFINENSKTLDSKPNAFFSVNLVARKIEKSEANTNPYLIKFLSQLSWKPKNLAVFAGKIDYQKYTYIDRMIIRLIMWMTDGPTDPKACIEYTDWDQVLKFGSVVNKIS